MRAHAVCQGRLTPGFAAMTCRRTNSSSLGTGTWMTVWPTYAFFRSTIAGWVEPVEPVKAKRKRP